MVDFVFSKVFWIFCVQNLEQSCHFTLPVSNILQQQNNNKWNPAHCAQSYFQIIKTLNSIKLSETSYNYHHILLMNHLFLTPIISSLFWSFSTRLQTSPVVSPWLPGCYVNCSQWRWWSQQTSVDGKVRNPTKNKTTSNCTYKAPVKWWDLHGSSINSMGSPEDEDDVPDFSWGDLRWTGRSFFRDAPWIWSYSWWFQPISKRWVNLHHFPINCNHQPV